MTKQPKFIWNSEKNEAKCILTDDKNRTFEGIAQCHPDDLDMSSEKTGCEIALRRATIKFLRFIRDNEIKPMLNAYKELYYEMRHSKKFNPKSYENLSLQRKIRTKEFDLTVINESIVDEIKNLKDYIDRKDIFYRAIRANRKGNLN